MSKEDLLEPLQLYVHQCGFHSEIKAVCNRGHQHIIGAKANTQRKYACGSSCNKSSREKLINYDINLLMATAQYLNGIGGTEMGRFAAALGLENHASIERNMHEISKKYVHHHVIKLTREIVHRNFLEEARQTLWEDNGTGLSVIQFETLWSHHKKAIEKGDVHKFIADQEIKLIGSVDMGWQKRSSGTKYDSPSGHIFIVGARTGRVIQFKVYSKTCRVCDTAEKAGTQPKPHNCGKNYNGSSSSMESFGAMENTRNIYYRYHRRAYMSILIADDDSSMKSFCSHTGELPLDVPEPFWLADPSHRIKVSSKVWFSLGRSPMGVSYVTVHDAVRLKLYLAHFIKRSRKREGVTAEWLAEHIMCVVEHLFDDHSLCTSDFCWKKKEEEQLNAKKGETQPSTGPPHNDNNASSLPLDHHQPTTTAQATEQPELSHKAIELEGERARSTLLANCDSYHDKKKKLRTQPGYYRDKKKHARAYKQIVDAFKPYTTVKAMKEILHPYHTQKNESLNTSIMYIAAKCKNYSKSIELLTRVSIAVGIDSMQREDYTKLLLEGKMGFVEFQSNLYHHLRIEDLKKLRKSIREDFPTRKSKRSEDKREQIINHRIEELAAARLGATYGEPIKKKENKQPKVSDSCRYHKYGCKGEKGHKSAMSKDCKFHKIYLAIKEKRNAPGKRKRNTPMGEEIDRAVNDEVLKQATQDSTPPLQSKDDSDENLCVGSIEIPSTDTTVHNDRDDGNVQIRDIELIEFGNESEHPKGEKKMKILK